MIHLLHTATEMSLAGLKQCSSIVIAIKLASYSLEPKAEMAGFELSCSLVALWLKLS